MGLPTNDLLQYGVQTGDYQPFITGGAVKPKKQTTNSFIQSLSRSVNDTDSYIDAQMKELASSNARIAALNSELAAMRKELMPAAPAYFDILGAQAKARKQAEKSVNPYYSKKIADFVAEQKRKAEVAKASATAQRGAIDSALGDTLEDIGISKTRTGEDVAANLEQLATEGQIAQEEGGSLIEEATANLAEQQSEAGLLTSGLGRQQARRVQQDFRTGEERQTQELNVRKKAQEQFRTRTFADLERESGRETRRTGEKKQLLDINLDDELKRLDFETAQEKRDTEKARLKDVYEKSYQFERAAVDNFIRNIKDPRVQQATRAAYG